MPEHAVMAIMSVQRIHAAYAKSCMVANGHSVGIVMRSALTSSLLRTKDTSMGKTLIIGANRGIGFELAKQLAIAGDDVVATYRSNEGELASLGAERVADVDVANAASLETLAGRFEAGSLDTVYVVAGVLEADSFNDFDEASLLKQFEINTLGPLRAVRALSSKLSPGGKVGLLTSRMGSVADNSSGGYYGYRMSKAALNMAGKSLALDLAPQEIAVALLHPGFVRTEMTGGNGHIDAAESAQGLIARMQQLTAENSGSFWHQDGQVLPW